MSCFSQNITLKIINTDSQLVFNTIKYKTNFASKALLDKELNRASGETYIEFDGIKELKDILKDYSKKLKALNKVTNTTENV